MVMQCVCMLVHPKSLVSPMAMQIMHIYKLIFIYLLNLMNCAPEQITRIPVLQQTQVIPWPTMAMVNPIIAVGAMRAYIQHRHRWVLSQLDPTKVDKIVLVHRLRLPMVGSVLVHRPMCFKTNYSPAVRQSFQQQTYYE